MASVIAWCGFLGAWLLVAGPVYQAALELEEEDIQREDLVAVAATVPPPERVSPWWWLLPPVGYVKRRRRNQAYREATMRALTHEQLEGFVSYMNKATGWLIVAFGGLLIGVKETWELAELNEWPEWVFWTLVVVLPLLCAVHTAARMTMSHRVLGDEPPPGRRPRKQAA